MQAVRRGEVVLTAQRTKSFLEGILDKQVEDLRNQTFGVGNFEKGVCESVYAVCCCGIQCFAVFGSVFQSLAVCCSVFPCRRSEESDT